MTANNENQPNSQGDPESGTPSSGLDPRKGFNSDGSEAEWIDDLGEEEFDDLADRPASGMANLPSPRAWDESMEASGGGSPPQRRTSSTFDDLPTFEQKTGSSDAMEILGDHSTNDQPDATSAEDSSGKTQPDSSLIKPGFDVQEQSIHLDAAQLARLAYAIEETPAEAAGEGKVRHEGAMDAAQLAQLAFAIEDDPGRAAQADSADVAHLASLAKAIQVTRSDSSEVSEPREPMEPTNHQLKYTFDDLAPINKGLLSGTSALSLSGTPPDSEGADDGAEATLRLQREDQDDVEETLRTSPRADDPLTSNGSVALPLGSIDNEVASRQPSEDSGETTLRLEKNDGESTWKLAQQASSDSALQPDQNQPPSQSQLPPVLGQLIKRPTSEAGLSVAADPMDPDGPDGPDAPYGLDASLANEAFPAGQATPQVRSGFGRILDQRSGASQSQNQLPAQQPVPPHAAPPMPIPGVVPNVPPTVSQSQLPAQPPGKAPPGAMPPPSMVSGQLPGSSPAAMATPLSAPSAAPSAPPPPVPGVPPNAAPSAPPPLPGAPPTAAASATPPPLPGAPYNAASAAPSPGVSTVAPSAPPPPPPPGAAPFAAQNPRISATNIPLGPAPFGIPAPEHRLPFNRAGVPAASNSVTTGDVPPVVALQPGLPQQAQAELRPPPTLGAPQQTGQVASGLTQMNGDSTFEIPLLDREVAASSSGDHAPSAVFFGKREAVLVRHAPSLSYKPSAKKATSQSYIELLTTKPQLPKKDVDDTTGENILVNNTPLVKISQGLSGAHPAQIPQSMPSDELAEPGFNTPNIEIMLSQASAIKLRSDPAGQGAESGEIAPPVPTTPMDPPLHLDRPPRRERPSNSRAGMPARGPVLLRGSAPDVQEGSQEQSIMPSSEGAVMTANRTPLILGGIVVVCMIVGLFAGAIFMSNKNEKAPPAETSSLTKPNQPDDSAPDQMSTYKRALAAEQRQDYTKALKYYSAGLTEKPDDPEMWSGRGRVLTHEGKFVRAESDLRKALELSPDNKKAMLDLAALFYYKKDYAEAVKQYNAIIKKQPDNADAIFGRGLTLVWLNKRKDAIKDYEKVITLSPKHVRAYQQLAVAYMDTGNAKQAIKILDAGLLNEPKSEELLFERALASYKLGKKEDAIGDYTKAIKLNSNRKDFFNDRGFVRLELRQYTGAIEDFKRALEIDPGYSIASDNLARAKKEQSE